MGARFLQPLERVLSAITLHFKRSAVFGPEEISAMSEAYDFALKSSLTPPAECVREAIAAGIIAAACTGERDPQKLAGRQPLRPVEAQ